MMISMTNITMVDSKIRLDFILLGKDDFLLGHDSLISITTIHIVKKITHV
jgi:hypothetical protein